MKYFVSNGGKIYGPIDEAKVRRKIAEGFFSRDCLVSLDRQEWIKPASQRAVAAKAQRQYQPQGAAENPGQADFVPPPEFIAPIAPQGNFGASSAEAAELTRKKRRKTILWVIVILVLLLIAGVVAVLVVDVFLLDRQILDQLESTFSDLF